MTQISGRGGFEVASIAASGGLFAGILLPFLSSPEGDALCQASCPVTGNLAGSTEAKLAWILLAGLAVGLVGYVMFARSWWALLGLMASAGAVALGLVSAFVNPGGVLPYVSAAPVSVDSGFWVFMAASIVGLATCLAMLGLPSQRSNQPQAA